MKTCPICAHSLPAPPLTHCPNCPARFERTSPFSRMWEGAVVLGIWLSFALATFLWAPLTGAQAPALLLQAWFWTTLACAVWLVWAAHRSSMRSLNTLRAALERG